MAQRRSKFWRVQHGYGGFGDQYLGRAHPCDGESRCAVAGAKDRDSVVRLYELGLHKHGAVQPVPQRPRRSHAGNRCPSNSQPKQQQATNAQRQRSRADGLIGRTGFQQQKRRQSKRQRHQGRQRKWKDAQSEQQIRRSAGRARSKHSPRQLPSARNCHGQEHIQHHEHGQRDPGAACRKHQRFSLPRMPLPSSPRSSRRF